jgi:hypothetical protein
MFSTDRDYLFTGSFHCRDVPHPIRLHDVPSTCGSEPKGWGGKDYHGH